jgi:hypothetical protein
MVSTTVQITLRKTATTTLQTLRPELTHKCVVLVVIESVAVLRCSLCSYQLFYYL